MHCLLLKTGRCFAASPLVLRTQAGEICFNTAMTGYQEVLTDPSYRGQIVAMTYPLVGNYGINLLDVESETPQVRGFVIEELSPLASNWRSQGNLHDFLRRHGIPGIQGIDTRALTRRLRNSGAMRACIAMEGVSARRRFALRSRFLTRESISSRR